jgi:dienelactone hydrolase
VRRYWRRFAIVIIVVLGISLAVGFVWLNDLADPTVEASAAMASDEAVSVFSDGTLVFQPAEPGDTGFILYPGGRVAAEAYAPLARQIAEAGYLTVIPPMPFGLAVLSPDAADGVIAEHPEIDRWVIGGHSLGGAMAAQYADGHTEVIDGLVLWAAYPAGGTDLSDTDLVVTSVSASEDGLASAEETQGSAAQLPPGTTFVEIEGGNHAGFGSYGPQGGDGVATISPAEQHRQVVEATLALLETVAQS